MLSRPRAVPRTGAVQPSGSGSGKALGAPKPAAAVAVTKAATNGTGLPEPLVAKEVVPTAAGTLRTSDGDAPEADAVVLSREDDDGAQGERVLATVASDGSDSSSDREVAPSASSTSGGSSTTAEDASLPSIVVAASPPSQPPPPREPPPPKERMSAADMDAFAAIMGGLSSISVTRSRPLMSYGYKPPAPKADEQPPADVKVEEVKEEPKQETPASPAKPSTNDWIRQRIEEVWHAVAFCVKQSMFVVAMAGVGRLPACTA